MTEKEESIRDNSNWYLVYTKPKQEKRAKENLIRQGVEVFLPLISKIIIESGERREVREEALFPRYFFIKASDNGSEISFINSTKGVSRLILFGEISNSSVPIKIIQGIKKMLGSNDTFQEEIVREKYKAGDILEIKGGAIEGLKGVFLHTSGNKRAKVLLELINSNIAATLPIEDIGMKESIKTIKF